MHEEKRRDGVIVAGTVERLAAWLQNPETELVRATAGNQEMAGQKTGAVLAAGPLSSRSSVADGRQKSWADVETFDLRQQQMVAALGRVAPVLAAAACAPPPPVLDP